MSLSTQNQSHPSPSHDFRVMSSLAVSPKTDMDREVTAMLNKPWDSIYQISNNGTYISPPSLIGVPVAKITEADPYYEKSWLSLDNFLAQESAEEALKKEYHDRLARDPSNQDFKDRRKRHQDNVSKHRKIREIFGANTNYHPNQLMSKHHLPPQGLCEKEIMYKLACKISDLCVLRANGQLSMDPWDFLRWRIARKAHSILGPTCLSARDIIKAVVYKICDDSGEGQAGKYEDRHLRKAILRSAQLQGRLASFGAKNVTKPHAITQPAGVRKARSTVRALPAITSLSLTSSSAILEERRKRREALTRPSAYQGVNAFRAQRDQQAH